MSSQEAPAADQHMEPENAKPVAKTKDGADLAGKKRQRRSRKKQAGKGGQPVSTNPKRKLRARMQPTSNLVKEYSPLPPKPSGKQSAPAITSKSPDMSNQVFCRWNATGQTADNRVGAARPAELLLGRLQLAARQIFAPQIKRRHFVAAKPLPELQQSQEHQR